MNKIFLSYKNSSNFYLNNIKKITVEEMFFKKNLISICKSLENLSENIIKTTILTDEGKYFFFENKKSEKGFLSRHDVIDKNIKVHNYHEIINECFGSIIDVFSTSLIPYQYSEAFSVNNEVVGLDVWENDYIKKCNNINMDANEKFTSLITIAFEANGNIIQYDINGNIYMSMPDHLINIDNYININKMPKNTFYKSSKTTNIEDWINQYFSVFL